MLNFDIILILTYIKALKRIKFNGYVTGKCEGNLFNSYHIGHEDCQSHQKWLDKTNER